MRRVLFGGLLVASLAVPAVALAVQPTGTNTNPPAAKQAAPHHSLGGGATGGNEPGHVESPGRTKIDTDSRGPINDVQPGRGTNDTPQSTNPKPVR